MWKRWFGQKDGKDTYQEEIYNRRQESQQIVEEDNSYSVLIHFVPDRNNAYVYMLKNLEVYDSDGAYVDVEIDSDEYVSVQGSFVYYSGFQSVVEAQEFITRYQLVNPIILNYGEE